MRVEGVGCRHDGCEYRGDSQTTNDGAELRLHDLQEDLVVVAQGGNMLATGTMISTAARITRV